jgi:hypothetical protein
MISSKGFVINNEDEGEKFTDIEKCCDNDNNNNESQLKSILKPTLSNKDYNNNLKLQINIIKIASIIFIFIISIPFIICDLYFAYNDDSCVEVYPKYIIFINMKAYLLVSGYYTIGLMCALICNLQFLSIENKNSNVIFMSILSVIINVSKVFLIIWNTIGAFIFWGTLYHVEKCKTIVYNYLFVSLVIKLLAILFHIITNKNKK